jgi:predicted transcriptional regulator of viral defense system
MRGESDEERLVQLALRQHGVVARRQLLVAGLSSSAIARRIDAGRLHIVHAGIYAVGHPLVSRDGRWMAAVLACGPRAAIGYGTAAAVWSLRRGEPRLVEIVAAHGRARTRDGVRVHRHPGLRRAEVTSWRGIPVTTPARTILDIAATASDRQLERALDQAEIQELTDYPSLDALARAHSRHRGSKRLRATLERHLAGTAKTRSDLEIAFRGLCEQHGFPPPLVNEPLCGITVDFVFAQQRVAVETDSWAWHRGRAAFERDRERDALLAAAGYRTLRFTDRQIELAPHTVVNALAAALYVTRPGSRGSAAAPSG